MVFLLCWPNIFNNNNNNRVAKNLESGFSSIVFAYNSSKKIPNFFPGSHEFSNYPFLSVFGPIFFAMISVEITQNHPVNFKQKTSQQHERHTTQLFPILASWKKEKNELVTPTLFYFLLLKVANAIYLPKFIHNRHLELKNFLPLSNLTLTLVRGEYLNKRQKKSKLRGS